MRLHIEDGMQQAHAVLAQKVPHFGEKFAVVRGAHVFEHADRYDAVKAPLLVAVVAQVKMDAVGESGFARALPRHPVLFLGQGDAGDIDVGDGGEIEPETAPAGADIEHCLARLEQQLGGDVALLVFLGLLQGVVFSGEIGAGILAVGVEKQIVQRAGKIVMMGDVPLRAAHRVVLPQPARRILQPPGHREYQVTVARRSVSAQIFEDVFVGAFLDDQGPVHIGLADMEERVGENLSVERGIAEAHNHSWPVGPGEFIGPSARIRQLQRSDGGDIAQCPSE